MTQHKIYDFPAIISHLKSLHGVKNFILQMITGKMQFMCWSGLEWDISLENTAIQIVLTVAVRSSIYW